MITLQEAIRRAMIKAMKNPPPLGQGTAVCTLPKGTIVTMATLVKPLECPK